MSNTDTIQPEQREKARTLLALAWYFSGKPQGNLTIGHYNALAAHIEAEIECTCAGKSIKNFAKSLEGGSLAGFKRNTTKETLAGYVLVKAGVIDEVDVVTDPTNRGINHPEHKYWIMFEEHYEDLKQLLPTPTQATGNNASHFDAFPLEPILPFYQDTVWMVYSRARKGGIYRHILVIEKEKYGHLNKVFMKNGSTGVEDYVGFVGMDTSKGFLIFDLVTCISKQKHLHVKVKVSRGAFPKFAAGQFNFISSVSNQVMSDVIVFVLASKDLDITTAAKCFIPGEPDYLEQLLCLRRYFDDSNECRLTSPYPDIINRWQFEEWLERQRAQKEPSKSDVVLLRFCDEYAVFYETPENVIEERFIRIIFDANVEEIHAAVATDYRNKFRKADVYRCEKSITLFNTEVTGCETRTCYLTFKIPLRADYWESFCFEGFVSGFWQGLNGSASRALVIKQSIRDFDARAKQLVRDFFWTTFQIAGHQ